MAKNGVEGVYTADPSRTDGAEFLPEITHREALERGLKVMDSTALSLCMDNHLPILRLQHGRRAQHRPDNVRRASGDAGEDMSLIDELLDDAREHMDKSVEATRAEVRLRAHGPRQPGAARPHQRRLLRRADPAQAAGDDQRARGAAAHRPAVRQELDQGDREGDPRVRPRADAEQRRRDHPPAGPRAHRGAPQAARQGRARDRRGGPRRDPQHPPRRHARPAGAARRPARPAPTTSTAPRTRCRSSPTRRSASSTRSSRARKKRSSRCDAPGRVLRRHHHRRQRALGPASAACPSRRATARAPTRSRRACATPSTSASRELTVYSFSTENWSRSARGGRRR